MIDKTKAVTYEEALERSFEPLLRLVGRKEFDASDVATYTIAHIFSNDDKLKEETVIEVKNDIAIKVSDEIFSVLKAIADKSSTIEFEED